MSLRVWPCRTEVQLKHSAYTGFIVAVSIRGLQVAYEIGYFEQEIYKTNVFEDYELDIHGSAEPLTLI
jgi:hypothetical protein